MSDNIFAGFGEALEKAQAAKTLVSVGDYVAVVLTPGIAPLRCYVGQVQAKTEQGIRLTLMDWIVGRADSWDLFCPWSGIQSALIATAEHDLSGFADAAANFQTRMNETK